MIALAAATLLFLVTHSLFASDKAKAIAAERLRLARWYRLAYSLWSSLTLALVLLLWWPSAQELLFEVSMAVRSLAWVLILLGASIALLAITRFGAAGFIGLAPEREGGLVRTGLHARVRHPIYTGIIVMLLGWCLAWPAMGTLLVAAMMLAYLPIGMRLEERKLIALFGGEYERYRREVPALWPRLLAGR
ncbi:MAG: isoprenylcysteine carboxylmethyltransferase family protein [Flavobacteriales bacterium]|nr:isoprenylcysteine carboxylmethyltransferase family protein [Flavobacteriales bacterium]